MKDLNGRRQGPAFLELTANKGSTVVVYFYPRDFTPGCNDEACEFRDCMKRL